MATIMHLAPYGTAWRHPRTPDWAAKCPSCRTSVALDYDGTMVRTTDLTAALVGYKRGEVLSARDVTSWDWWERTGRGPDFWGAISLMDRTHLRNALEPYDPNVRPVVRHLMRAYARVEVVTANADEAAASIMTWMKRHVSPDLPVRAIGRGPVARKVALGFKVYLDDCPDLAPLVPHVKRFRSWAEVPDLVLRCEALDGQALLLANARWNEDVEDKGAFA